MASGGAGASIYYAAPNEVPDSSKWRGPPPPSPAGWVPTPLPHLAVRHGFHAPVELRESVHGRGLFATCDIPKNTLIWKLVPCTVPSREGNCWAYHSEAEFRARLAGCSREVCTHVLDHVFMTTGILYEILDEGDVWNHSDKIANTGYPPTEDGYDIESSYATRDIAAGEELLDNYSLYEYPDWYEGMKAEFNARWDFVENKVSSHGGHKTL